MIFRHYNNVYSYRDMISSFCYDNINFSVLLINSCVIVSLPNCAMHVMMLSLNSKFIT